MPRPQRHVFICSQNRPAGHPRGSCGQKGCREIVDEFTAQWQKRQLFTEVAVTPTGCLGPCSIGPSVLVYPEGVMYGNVTKADIDEIFEQHLIGGVPVQRLIVPKEVW